MLIKVIIRMDIYTARYIHSGAIDAYVRVISSDALNHNLNINANCSTFWDNRARHSPPHVLEYWIWRYRYF